MVLGRTQLSGRNKVLRKVGGLQSSWREWPVPNKRRKQEAEELGDPVKFVDRVVRSCGISFSLLCEGRDMVIV